MSAPFSLRKDSFDLLRVVATTVASTAFASCIAASATEPVPPLIRSTSFGFSLRLLNKEP